MRIRLFICALLASCSVYLVHSITGSSVEFVEFYSNQLRGNIFSGLLTVGGFLLSLKTFIVIKLKENVYDHEEYDERYKQQRKLDSSLRKYAPLQRLSNFLFWSVLTTILGAVIQLTLGILGNYWLCLVAIWSSVFAVCVLLLSLLLIKSALDDYFRFINTSPR